MKQAILRQGDLVRYYIRNETLDGLGFVMGQFYIVETGVDGDLISTSPRGIITLVSKGYLSDDADHFAKLCPLTLPLGQLQKRLYPKGK